ncbi:MAG: hypothetical protein Q9163_000876 [Psora crenata]
MEALDMQYEIAIYVGDDDWSVLLSRDITNGKMCSTKKKGEATQTQNWDEDDTTAFAGIVAEILALDKDDAG